MYMRGETVAFETWATYAVNDHLQEQSFARDVMMFDRLAIPFPPPGNDAEWARWENAGWDPTRQRVLLDILGNRAVTVPWDDQLKERWKNRFEAGADMKSIASWAFAATRIELTENLPSDVTGIESLAAYQSLEELKRDYELKKIDQHYQGSVLTAIIGREFLFPDVTEYRGDDLLKAAVEASEQPVFKRRRTAFWQWEQTLIGRGVVKDEQTVRAAVDEMRGLVNDEEAELRRTKIKFVVDSVILVGSITVSMFAAALAPFAVAGALFSVGQFASDRLLKSSKPETAAALFGPDTRTYFGGLWPKMLEKEA